MKYVVRMGSSVVMTYMIHFIKFGSGIQTMIQRPYGDHISLLLCPQNKEIRLLQITGGNAARM
jgi:hypothetical protein